MRNWNMKIGDKQDFRRLLRAYLWGIETLLNFVLPNQKEWLRAYLWGIETPSTGAKLFLMELVASLPMRNWNLVNQFLSNIPLVRCEPTYEELKPLLTSELELTLLGCEPTYEELKQKIL